MLPPELDELTTMVYAYAAIAASENREKVRVMHGAGE
jgi:hypothetical protein